jgi:hypothetical protein
LRPSTSSRCRSKGAIFGKRFARAMICLWWRCRRGTERVRRSAAVRRYLEKLAAEQAKGRINNPGRIASLKHATNARHWPSVRSSIIARAARPSGRSRTWQTPACDGFRNPRGHAVLAEAAEQEPQGIAEYYRALHIWCWTCKWQNNPRSGEFSRTGKSPVPLSG